MVASDTTGTSHADPVESDKEVLTALLMMFVMNRVSFQMVEDKFFKKLSLYFDPTFSYNFRTEGVCDFIPDSDAEDGDEELS